MRDCVPSTVSSSAVAACAAGLVICVLVGGCTAAVDRVAIEDAQTAARVKTALINDPDLGTAAIEVRVERRVVLLSGRVRTRADADRAEAVARAVSGVQDVNLFLQVGADDPVASPGAGPGARTAPGDAQPEPQGEPNLLAVGASVSMSLPRAGALKSRVAVGPLIKFGSGQGLGIALGFDWFQAEVQSTARPDVLTRVHIKPIMFGVSYTLTSDRVSLSPSVVAGYAFNSLTVTDRGSVAGLPVEVDNSLVWRVGASAWFDVNRRVAFNVSGGYLMTNLRLTVLEGSRLVRQDQRGDTALLRAGLAYRLF